jgi:hypothetical protein
MDEKFERQMLIMEMSLPPKARSDEERQARRDGMWDAVSDIPINVITEARRRYCNKTDEGEYHMFPTPGQLRRICLDIIEEARVEKEKKRISSRKTYSPQTHKCTTPADISKLVLVRLALLPYEAEHVACQGKIKTTCPDCGALHEYKSPVITGLMKHFPLETAGWNPLHKGLMRCKKCQGVRGG